MEQKLAIIDLGTNTFHLLIAMYGNKGYTISHRERAVVKIGVGGINQDIILEEGIARAVEALKTFKAVIDQQSITTIYAFGTSAFRNARNAHDVKEKIKQATTIEVNIISGDEEAEFIYKGVKSALNLGGDPSLIMDIGGGSVEFIIGNRNGILWKKSIEIGAQRLLDKFQKHDPILQSEISELNTYFENELNELMTTLQKFNPSTLIGSSGTFDTLSEIHCIRNSIAIKEEDAETPLTLSSFYSIYQELINKNRAERMLIPGMIEMRVDMIVVASCLIRFLLAKHLFNGVRVSTYALKEGVLATITPPWTSPAGEGGVGL